MGTVALQNFWGGEKSILEKREFPPLLNAGEILSRNHHSWILAPCNTGLNMVGLSKSHRLLCVTRAEARQRLLPLNKFLLAGMNLSGLSHLSESHGLLQEGLQAQAGQGMVLASCNCSSITLFCRVWSQVGIA